MAELDVHRVMAELAERRPIFHSEADFRFALAWRIAEMKAGCGVRLEKPFRRDDKTRYLDIWLPTSRTVMELKYCTRDLSVEHRGEGFALKNQSANDLRRYDFVADLVRIEGLLLHGDASAPGYAVFLTNDPLYWRPGQRTTRDEAFRLHEGRRLEGMMEWRDEPGQSATGEREDSLALRERYDLRWKHYCALPGAYGEFRYIAVEVKQRFARSGTRPLSA